MLHTYVLLISVTNKVCVMVIIYAQTKNSMWEYFNSDY